MPNLIRFGEGVVVGGGDGGVRVPVKVAVGFPLEKMGFGWVGRGRSVACSVDDYRFS